MKKIHAFAAVTAAVLMSLHAAHAGESKPLPLPKPPPAVPQTLPLNAQPTANGVYIPVTRSGNTGVSVEGLRSAAPGEKGAAVSLTFKTP